MEEKYKSFYKPPPEIREMTEAEQEQMAEVALLDAETKAALDALPFRQMGFAYAIGSGQKRKEAMAKTGLDSSEASRALQSEKVLKAIRLVQQGVQLRYGISAAWKRQKLRDIVDANQNTSPAAAVSALKLLVDLDHDTDRYVNHPKLANAPLLDRQQSIANLVSEGQLSLENAKMLSTLTDSQINSGQLKLVNELVKRIEAGEEPGLVATDLLGRLPEAGQQTLPSFL